MIGGGEEKKGVDGGEDSSSSLSRLDGTYQVIPIEDKAGSEGRRARKKWRGVLATTGSEEKVTIRVTDVLRTWRSSYVLEQLRTHADEAGLREIPSGQLVGKMKESFESKGSLSLQLNRRGASLIVRYDIDGIPLEGRLALDEIKSAEPAADNQAKAVLEIFEELIAYHKKEGSARDKDRIKELEDRVEFLENSLEIERNLRNSGSIDGNPNVPKEKRTRPKKIKNRNAINPLMRRRAKKKVKVGRR